MNVSVMKKWDEIGALTQEKFGVNITKLITDALTNIANFFKNTWDNVKKGFGEMWDGMKRLAGDGINAVIALPNAGIDGINKLISDLVVAKKLSLKFRKLSLPVVLVCLAHTETQSPNLH